MQRKGRFKEEEEAEKGGVWMQWEGGEGGRGRGGGGGWMQHEEWKEVREDATGRKVKVGG